MLACFGVWSPVGFNVQHQYLFPLTAGCKNVVVKSGPGPQFSLLGGSVQLGYELR